jgi:hypothetical protein
LTGSAIRTFARTGGVLAESYFAGVAVGRHRPLGEDAPLVSLDHRAPSARQRRDHEENRSEVSHSRADHIMRDMCDGERMAIRCTHAA